MTRSLRHVVRVAAKERAGTGTVSHLIFGLLALLRASVAPAADAPPLILEHLSTSDGLPQATVMTTLQDSQGFVWLGTEDGLVRFDGHELFRYAYSRSERESLPGNFIWQVVEDAHHDLWVATKDTGLARWNRATDKFTVYRHDPRNPVSLGSDKVRTVLVDPSGLVWVGTTDAGIDILDPSSGQVKHLRNNPNDASSLSNNRIFSLTLDRSGDVWAATGAGLDRWQRDRQSFVRFGPPASDERSLNAKQISRVLEDRSGILWVGAFNGGLTRMDRDGRVLETFHHDPRLPDSLGGEDVRAILEDQEGHLWVGTSTGLDLLDRASGQFSHYTHVEGDNESLRDSFVMSLYQDYGGVVWIGTRAGGVSRWNPHSWEFGGHRPAWLGNAPVTAFADAPGNKLWIASMGGLFQFDGETGNAAPLDTLVGRHNVVGDVRVMSLRHDHLGNLWIGTMTAGLKKLSPDGRVDSIPVKAGNPHALSAAGIMTIVESRSGQIWVGTFGGGANILDPATGSVRQLPFGTSAPGAVSAPNVTAIAEDAHGNQWIGTDGGGLNLARADGTVVKVFRHDTHDLNSLPANTVYALAIDPAGRVWVGTDGGGLVRVLGSADSPDSIRFEAISRAEGLSSDTVYGVVPDAHGHLWLSGNAGLTHFDPETRAIKTYHREHGLQGEEFSFGAYFLARDGRLCFGGPGGFNLFDPARLVENRQPPRLALTSVEVLGVRAASATPYWLRDRIDLNHRASIVSLDFGVLDFTSPKHNRLAYRMAGLTDRWIDLGAQRRITLTNLDAGDHVLEVRAANSDSVWSPKPAQITIHRDPAPWRSAWAYAAYALTVLGLVLYRAHRQRVRFQEVVLARERLEAQVQLRTRELLESNRQLAEAAQAKSNFLDRMSHELRTPMNGVVGMTELLSRTALSATQSHLTKTIRSSAQILLQIVNDLLDLSKIRAGKVALEALPIDLGQVLEECTSLFAGAAEAKGIELIVCPPARPQVTLLGDPLRVRQILMNLVGNAVKFTAQGEVAVRADIGSRQGDRATVQLFVTDTGIGMDAAAISKIFEPFAQADETTTRRFGGTGLGLSICRELADLMGGTMTVESKPQIGSTFCLSFPLQVDSAVSLSEPTGLPSGRVRIVTRRPTLAESLARHASLLGLTVVSDIDDAEKETDCDDVVIVDASSRQDFLKDTLAKPHSSRPALVVVATAAQIEALDLRVLLHEKAIVLKPVHRIALQEALAVALGVPLSADARACEVATGGPQLKGHVLLVEDEPVNAAVAQGYLEALGCTSVWVQNGAEAVARGGAEHFDLILMDLNMPGMDGFATAALVRQREQGGPRVPIVALTAHDAASYRERVLKAGMDDILSKPYALEDCTRLLQRWLMRADALSVSNAATSAKPAVGTLASIDAAAVETLRKLRADKHADLYSKLVELFRAGSADSLAKLRAALHSGDLPAAAAVCHKLASSAANVGALVYAKQVRQLERVCIAGEEQQARELHDRLQGAYPQLIDTLQSMTLRATA
jgi:signal transduction histidine kinase/ligand-binding sensor domain-containing protein/CheY-like chemotaxis protein/HPt (histidine-containing phosphotransfer) domain-containing protein